MISIISEKPECFLILVSIFDFVHFGHFVACASLLSEDDVTTVQIRALNRISQGFFFILFIRVPFCDSTVPPSEMIAWKRYMYHIYV